MSSQAGNRNGPRRYPTPMAFRQALESRLRERARHTGQPFLRLQSLFLFDRFLARLQQAEGPDMVLKGGMALELRLERARTTKDIDVRWPVDADDVQRRLEYAGGLDLGDFLHFEVRPDEDHPDIDEAAQYEGRRFRVTPLLGGKSYVSHFGIDVITGGPMIRPAEEIEREDWLDFAGIAPPRVKVLPVETHVAEKLHAYTLPRQQPNSRVKDLPDLALLATTGALQRTELRRALQQTFRHRRTHELPTALPDPPPAWKQAYERMARDNDLRWNNLEQVTEAVRAFLDPVLHEPAAAEWLPSEWRWQSASD